MLISFPFLRNAKPEETDAVDDGAFNLGEKSGKGAFPVSYQFGWHGGMHLIAPGEPQDPEPVRAIADGTVVFARDSTQPPPDNASAEAMAAHPLLYYTGWTSNGVMIIRHETEIGEGVSVTFHSIYQHLHTVANKPDTQTRLNKGDKVYRKDAIGQAGSIYGKANRIHFEIVADRRNVEALMGRSAGELTAAQGRRTSVWGDMHIVLPANTPLYAQDPRKQWKSYGVRFRRPGIGGINDTLNSVAQRFHTTPERIRKLNGQDAAAADWWSTLRNGSIIKVPAQYGAAAATPPADLTLEDWRLWQATISGRTQEELIVSLSEARGTITLTTRNRQGVVIGACKEQNGGYNLYGTAVETYPGCPSAGYEMLRFGRILGPDAPAATDLQGGRLPHLRRIVTKVGVEAFADLNTAGVKVYSDADFPHWQGWTFIDDDTDGNSRCDSTRLLDLIEPMASTPSATPGGPDETLQYKDRLARAYAKIHTASMRERLSYCVVKLPTEWSRDDFDQRWGWVKGDDPNDVPANVLQSVCLSSEAYGKFKRHHAALAFREDAVKEGLALDKVHYHFHPLRFIQTFKRCGWLSQSETVQLLPATGLGLTYNQALTLISNGQSTEQRVLPPRMWVALNLVRRKYQIESILRTAHFWAQIAQETDGLQTVREYASGAAYEGRTDLGNTQLGDGVRFRGRGVIQVTGRANYARYEKYRNTTYTTEPNQLLLQSDAYVAADASGLYWTAEATRDRYANPPGSPKPYKWILDGKININTRADRITFQTLTNEQSFSADVLNVTLQINRAALHLDRRNRYFKHAYKMISDDVTTNLPGGNLKP